ncbi:hypothetical protein J8J04_02510 ['Fragaria x ananassa' phyllody phytoplasma]|uniref:Uncharacterized protein n=1 Tax='Fragaria x ananassa' phyllody phytoplasma TaxID=2358428 RepID=A0ABS5K3P1_9MOLU|nr:hypothetical protein ['Fragaria x ananassa' phyllody phytoplasma]MBS2126548.1 hypothetical protein ['Fragaria x ananassa' phyllody phytoplasma]
MLNQKPNEDNPNIKLILSNIFVGQSKEEVVNQYLINNNIIKEPKLIKLGCYNVTPNTGLVVPLPLTYYNGHHIEDIYFDDGIRIMKPQQGNIEDLLKLSNRTKNIYLFTFNA